MNERTRAIIYRVEMALVPLLIYYGLVSEEAAALWAGLIAAVLGFGLASKHTSLEP